MDIITCICVNISRVDASNEGMMDPWNWELNDSCSELATAGPRLELIAVAIEDAI